MTSREFLKQAIADGSLKIAMHYRPVNEFSITYKGKTAFAFNNRDIEHVLDGICIGNGIQPSAYYPQAYWLSKYSIYHPITNSKSWIYKKVWR